MAHYIFKMPDIGEGVVEGEVVTWHVAPGDSVVEDQPLVDIMTDKATVTIPSTVHGKVVRTAGKVGDMVGVGRELVVFEVEDGSIHDEGHHAIMASAEPSQPASARRIDGAIVGAAEEAVEGKGSAKPRPLASPAVRRRARELGIDLAIVRGSGPAGRIQHADLDAYVKTGRMAPAAPRVKRTGTTEIPLVGLRRRIAEKMVASHRHIPTFSYFEEVDVTELERLRVHLNEPGRDDRPKLTYLPFILLALVKALRRHPAANAHFDEDRQVILRHDAIHLGVASQTEKGLMVPVIHHAEARDLWDLARELRRVTDAARAGTATSGELTGSTFTVTSLGKLGGLGATPILNAPEVGILGIHRAEDRAVVQNGAIVVRRRMNLSSSFDHRVVDGYDGAQLVQSVKGLLEHPATLFLDD